MRSGPIVFFDGVCPLCWSAVALLARVDRRGRLRFAPLGGETADELLAGDSRLAGVDSLVLLAAPGSLPALRSQALAVALRIVGGPWTIVSWLLRLVPLRLRDRLYDVVAARRRRWFGQLERCPAPPARSRDRFLP